MIRALKNKKAQVNVAEYTILIVIVVSMVTAMSVYFRRTVQARIREARIYMYQTAHNETKGLVIGNFTHNGHFRIEYEPYYQNTTSFIGTDDTITRSLRQGASSGIFGYSPDTSLTIVTNSIIAPPKDANDPIPGGAL